MSVAAGQAGWWSTTVCLPTGDNAYAFDVVGNSFVIGDPPPHPVLAVTKSDGRTTAYRSDTLTYTIHVTNNGTGSAFGTTLADALPAALTYVLLAWHSVGHLQCLRPERHRNPHQHNPSWGIG